MTRVTEFAQRANFWSHWLPKHLPPELGPHISGVVERAGTLVIFAESAAWSTRLRFTILELEPQIRAAADSELATIEVRVRPKDQRPP